MQPALSTVGPSGNPLPGSMLANARALLSEPSAATSNATIARASVST